VRKALILLNLAASSRDGIHLLESFTLLSRELVRNLGKVVTRQEMIDFRLIEELREADSCEELHDLRQEVIDLKKSV
jgi:hypothetical protein